jgi:serine/threonine protein kinase
LQKYAVNGSLGAELKRNEAKSRAFYTEFQSIGTAFSNDLVQIIRSMLSLDPKKRPSASELLSSDYFSDFRRELFSTRRKSNESSSSSSGAAGSPAADSTAPDKHRRIWLLFSFQPNLYPTECVPNPFNFAS